ncbi:MAG: hypothetical protein P8Q97_19050 [Myxococcota bacterium]|jgi:hypothetical protein|nr:hypothetical protein [Myxococcota bacterium]
MKTGVLEQIRAAGGEVYAVTSEPQALASRAREDWGLSFECVGDPHHEVAATLSERGWLDLRVLEVGEFLTRDTQWEVSHPKGIFQPGILALAPGQRVLYRWRSIPTRKNVGGAVSRPTPGHVWGRVQEALAEGAEGDAAHDETPVLDGGAPPFAFFALVLMAHGWFLRPRAFTYQGDGNNPTQRFPMMVMRLVLFVALWVAGFALLPGLWMGVALALYLPVGIRGLREVYTTFESVQA